VNAFALPGGFVYVNTGLVLNAENEAELAGVLAHEIAHVAARHGTKQATRGQLLQYAALPLIFVGGSAGFLIYEAATLAAPIEFSHFSRGMETEADTLGLKYVYQSGYDPAAFVDFFEKLQSQQKKNPNIFARAFSSHPMNNSRIRHAQIVIQTDLRPEPRYVLDTSEFHSIRDRLEAAQKRREAYRSYSLPTLRPRPEMK
jgi:beta-barrel assembly-enhancing protease